jgi:hypothetical protein
VKASPIKWEKGMKTFIRGILLFALAEAIIEDIKG